MSIIPLEKTFSSKHFKELFDECFGLRDAPYGKNISSNFLEKRVFASSIYSTDCSKAIFSKSGELCGFAIANFNAHPLQKQSDALYLNLFFIADAYRNRGLGQALINELVTEARIQGKKLVKTSLQWAGIWPGILSHWKNEIGFCQKTGGQLKPGELFIEVDLQQALSRRDSNAIVRPYSASDFEALQELLVKNFSVGWTHEVFNKVCRHFDNFNGYGLAFPYCPEDVLVAESQKGICGFCVVQSTTDDKMSFFGPIGIDPDFRRMGIGSQLLFDAIDYLKDKGKEKMGLWATERNYNRFYQHFGLPKTFETVHVEWPAITQA
jgi:GNAT superfamily N-acetyltransferase